MKTLILISLIFITLFSCKKDNITPTSTTVIKKDTLSMWGKWKLIDGNMYLTNFDTGENTYYSHFGIGRSKSSLRMGGSLFAIEDIIKDTTTYEFRPPVNGGTMGSFYLNNDKVPYGLNCLSNYITIVENSNSLITPRMGGSARPIKLYVRNFNSKTAYLQIETINQSINGYNCEYFNYIVIQKISE